MNLSTWINKRKLTIVGVVMLASRLAMPAIVSAQEATITGTVTDSSGAVVPGATVTALHQASGNMFVSVTDARGVYYVAARAGEFQITVELQGFTTVNRTGVQILVGQQAVVGFELKPSAVQETVTVAGQLPILEVTKSILGGNIDPRQVQDIPINGRNMMDLTMLAPGSRQSTVSETPAASFQINLDGQEVTQDHNGSMGEPRYSMDAIAEFQFVSSRFDATQGRSVGVQVNAITKSGTNNYGGTVAGYFRDSSLNAADFIQKRVLPYSNQQVSSTFGGPIQKDKTHFFVNFEDQRQPQTITYSSPYPAFNIDQTGSIMNNMGGVKIDREFSASTRVVLRASTYNNNNPYNTQYTGGATKHPSSAVASERHSRDFNLKLSEVLSNTTLNEVNAGYDNFSFQNLAVVPWANGPLASLGFTTGTPIIQLRGYTIGQGHTQTPLHVIQDRYAVRDDFTHLITKGGSHSLKLGGEYLYDTDLDFATPDATGVFDASNGPIPTNITSLFPVWNDPNSWNLNALNPLIRSYTLGIGNFATYPKRPTFGTWAQDDWTIGHFTMNLGLRYDFAYNVFAQNVTVQPFLTAGRPQEKANFGPRLGFAYSLDDKTVIRGGTGKYFADVQKTQTLYTQVWAQQTLIQVLNDGRPDFATNPFNGPVPTLAQVVASGYRRTISSQLASPVATTPNSIQSSIGVDRQLGETMSVEVDYVEIRNKNEINSRNINLMYNPATGANYAYTDIAHLPYPGWGQVSMSMTDGASNYHALQMAFTKRFADRWQLAANYSFTKEYTFQPAPLNPGCQYPMTAPGVCNVPITLAPDLAAQWYLNGSPAHRAVFNGVWQIAHGLQLSGLYFFTDNGLDTASAGVDTRNTGSTSGRLLANGTLLPRNGLDRAALHRVDARLQQRFNIGHLKVDGFLDAFNLFNHANYGSYVTNFSSATYGQPSGNTAVAYQPRMLQLGFRTTF